METLCFQRISYAFLNMFSAAVRQNINFEDSPQFWSVPLFEIFSWLLGQQVFADRLAIF